MSILLNPIFKWTLNTNFSSFLSEPVTQSPSDVVDLTDVTLACEGSWVAPEYFMERLSLLLMPEQNRSHVVDARKKHVFDSRTKKYVVDARTKQKPCCWCKICSMNLLKLQHQFVKFAAWICWYCYVNLSKLFYVFIALSQITPGWSLT